MEAEAEGHDEAPDVARGLQALSPQLRVALCSPDVSQLLHRQSRPAVFAAAAPPLPGALDREDARATRVLLQPIAVLTGAREGAAADVLYRLRRLRFSADYCGQTAAPVCLDLVAPPAGGGEGVGLEPAGGAARALELHLPALHPAAASAVAADELLQSLQTRPLQVDVWDGDSGFALGSVAVSGMARLVRQGHATVYFYDICPFAQPLAPPGEKETKGNSEPRVLASAAAATKEVQVRGLERGASVAFRIISCAHDPALEAHAESAGWGGGVIMSHKQCEGGTSPARVPFKARNSDGDARSVGGGSASVPESQRLREDARGVVESLLKLAQGAAGGFSGWHRVHPDQRDLPQRAALALVFVNQNRILEALRASAHARAVAAMAAMDVGGPKVAAGGGRRRRWSEVSLSADDAGLTDALKPLDLDPRHLHALCLKLQEAAAGPEGAPGRGGSGGGERVIDLQSMLVDSRYSPSLELKGEVAVGKMDALDIKARRAIQRLVRDVLAAMAGRSLGSMLNPVALFASAAPNGIMEADGFRELVAHLQVAASDSVVYAGWRAICQGSLSEHGADVAAFLNFFSVSAVHRQQACSLKLLSALPSSDAEGHGAGAGGAGGGGGHTGSGGSARTQRQLQLLKDLLHDSDLWREYREACAAVRAAQRGAGGKPDGGGKGQVSGASHGGAADTTPVKPAAARETSAASPSGTEKKGDEGGGDTLEERMKTRDAVLKDLARFLQPKVGGMSEKEVSSALESLHELQVADHQRKAARLRALLSAGKDGPQGVKDRATGDVKREGGAAGSIHSSSSAVPHSAGGAGAEDAADAGGGSEGERDKERKVSGETGGKGEGKEEVGAARGGGGEGEGEMSEDAVRRALELKGLLHKGGGWVPARIAAEVPMGSAGTRVLCPLVNRSEQTLCFELSTETAEPGGGSDGVTSDDQGAHADGVVRIDNGDQELQLLKNFHMCQFVEAKARAQGDESTEFTDGSSFGKDSKGRDVHARVNAEVMGGVLGVKVVVQPRARVTVPLVFFRGQMLLGAKTEKPVMMRVRRALEDESGRETFGGAVVLEEKLLVCGSVRPPRADHTVRLFVRDFAEKFGIGSAFPIRQHLRFPYSAPEKGQGGASAHLEEIWMSLSAAGVGKQKKRASVVSKASVAQAPQAVQNKLKVDADLMRCEGRRWVRLPGENLSDRLVTEILPVADFTETNHVRFFCTTLLAVSGRSSTGKALLEWSEQWGGDMFGTGRIAKPMVFPKTERQWVWEIRPVAHQVISIPPPVTAPPVSVPSEGPTSLAEAASSLVESTDTDAITSGARDEAGAGDEVAEHPGEDGAGDTPEAGRGGEAIAESEQAQMFDVQVTLERPWSLWGQDSKGFVYSSAPQAVRSDEEAQAQVVVQGKDKVELRLRVSRQHDASPVFLHVVGQNGLLSAWQLTFVHSAAKARMTACGVRITLEELRFTRQGQVLLPSRGSTSGQLSMEVAALKTRLRTDLAQALGCEVTRVQLTKISAREALPHGPALEVFRSLDTDGSGKLERHELRLAVKQMRIHGLMIDDVDALLAILDPSGDGEVTFEEFIAALDSGFNIYVLLLPFIKPDEESGQHAGVQLSPADLAENLYKMVVDSTYGTSRGGGGSGLVGLLRYCGEIEVLPTSLHGARGQNIEEIAAVRIQKRVRGVQARDKKRRQAQYEEIAATKIQGLYRRRQTRGQRAAQATNQSEASARTRQGMSAEAGEEEEEDAEEVEDSEDEKARDVAHSDQVSGGKEGDGSSGQARARKSKAGNSEDAQQEEEAGEAGSVSEVSDSPRESEVGTGETGVDRKEGGGSSSQARARKSKAGNSEDAEQEEAEEAEEAGSVSAVSDSPRESEVGTGEKGAEEPRRRARASAVEAHEEEEEEDAGDLSDLSASDEDGGAERDAETSAGAEEPCVAPVEEAKEDRTRKHRVQVEQTEEEEEEGGEVASDSEEEETGVEKEELIAGEQHQAKDDSGTGSGK